MSTPSFTFYGVNIAGLDISNTCTGVVVLDEDGTYRDSFALNYAKNTKKKEFNAEFQDLILNKTREFQFNRYAFYIDKIIKLLNENDIRLVGIEGYSFHSQSQAVTKLAELGALVRQKLIFNEIAWVEVTPNAVKKFTTGKGIGPKSEVRLGVYKNWNLEFEHIDTKEREDVADAFGVAAITYNLVNINARKKLKKFQLEVVEKVELGLSDSNPKKKRKKKDA